MVAINATFSKATTTVDGGWAFTFSTHEGMAKEITEVTAMRDESLYVVVMTESEFFSSRNAIKRDG